MTINLKLYYKIYRLTGHIKHVEVIEFVNLLNELLDLDLFITDEDPGTVYFIKKNKIYMDVYNKTLHVRTRFMDDLMTRYDLKFSQIEPIIEEFITEHYKINIRIHTTHNLPMELESLKQRRKLQIITNRKLKEKKAKELQKKRTLKAKSNEAVKLKKAI